MRLSDLSQLWENQPQVMWLFAGGLVVFVVVVIDTWRVKRHRRRKEPRKH